MKTPRFGRNSVLRINVTSVITINQVAHYIDFFVHTNNDFRFKGCISDFACVASVPVRAERNNRAARRSFAFRTRGKIPAPFLRLFFALAPFPSLFLLSPHFSRFLFALVPFSVRPECDTPSRGPIISLGSYGNACYAGNIRLVHFM